MDNNLITYLRAPETIRSHCQQIYDLAANDQLRHFRLKPDALNTAVQYLEGVIKDSYPNLEIPFHSRWRHLEEGKTSPRQLFAEASKTWSREEWTRSAFDVIVTSVLLDAGAGDAWKYRWAVDGKLYERSEGLAVASFELLRKGAFSGNPQQPMQVDAIGLEKLTKRQLGDGFQVNIANPLNGLEGRLHLLKNLGQILKRREDVFYRNGCARLGHLYDYLVENGKSESISARTVLSEVLDIFSEIWPSRLSRDGINLGDVWEHPQVRGSVSGSDRLVPFHKLSQWLTYSLLETLEKAEHEVSDINALTGLAEYRNGGFFIDTGVLVVRDPTELIKRHQPSSQLIVEWRALTIVLLDQIAERLRAQWNKSPTELPMVKVLQGGTWLAGRRLAHERRDGSPPIMIESDGTVF